MTADKTIVGGGRFGTGRDGYAALTKYARQWRNRVWAIEVCQGIGRHIANRLLADGEQVVDVPPKLSARARTLLRDAALVAPPPWAAVSSGTRAVPALLVCLADERCVN